MRLYYKVSMELFRLTTQTLCPCIAEEGVALVPLTENRLHELESLLGRRRTKQAANQLKRGDTGLLAILDGKIVGCGWLKRRGTRDPYYRVGENAAYLSSFVVDSAYRGRGIYPAMITRLIQNEDSFRAYYISAYTTNKASLKGLKKTGFEHIRTLVFWRAFKMTFNKYLITSEMKVL